MIRVELDIEELWLAWRIVSEVEHAPQACFLGGKQIDPRARAGEPGANDCHGFCSLRSLRFLIEGLDEPTFLAQLIQIF